MMPDKLPDNVAMAISQLHMYNYKWVLNFFANIKVSFATNDIINDTLNFQYTYNCRYKTGKWRQIGLKKPFTSEVHKAVV